MDRKEFVNKLKSMFSEVEAEVVADIPAEEEFKDITTIDGVILRTTEAGLVEGEKLLVISSEEEGAETEADAPEGEYTVEGQDIAVGSDGVITSVTEAEVDTSDDNPFTVAGTTIDFVHSLESLGDVAILECDGTNIFLTGNSKLDGAILLA